MSGTADAMVEHLYNVAKAADWTALQAALVGEQELAALCSRYKKPSSGWTFLHQAGYAGEAHVARALIRLGASTTARGREGETPADVAEKRGHQALAAMLHAAAKGAGAVWEAPLDAGLLPSSCAWSEGRERRAPRDMRVGYAGGVVTIPSDTTYYVDSFERALIGWHGSYAPPRGMDGEAMF